MLHVDDLRKRYDAGHKGTDSGHLAVDGVSFHVPDGKMYTLLGPSGCGKTTTLRCVAGLETPSGGVVSLRGRPLFDARTSTNVPPNERELGMVFQSYAIWPHMTVEQNVAYPLRVGRRARRVQKEQVRARVDEVLVTVGLEGYGPRRATALSGGQQQRLALARALIARPRMLLLDEPLSNLDAKLRESMRLEIKRLQRESGITSLYVTHDQVEALAMSNIIAVMKDGRIVQEGTPDQIYKAPVNAFVADFIGSANLVPGTVRSSTGESCVVATGGGLLSAQPSPADPAPSPGAVVLVAVRAECVVIEGPADRERTEPDTLGCLEGTVRNRAFLGELIEHELELSGGTLLRVRGMDVEPRGIGERVRLRVRAHECRIVPAG